MVSTQRMTRTVANTKTQKSPNTSPTKEKRVRAKTENTKRKGFTMTIVQEKQGLSEFEGLAFTASITKEPFTTVEVIERSTGVSRHAIMQLINNHKKQLEAFGILAFEMRKLNVGRGRPTKVWHLNENQATLLITMLDNTPQVVRFKTALVKAFFDYRDQTKQWQEARQDNRLTNKDLAVIIKERYPDNLHLYQNLHRLAWVQAIGITPAKFKALHGVKDPYSALTPKQEQTLESVKEAIKALVNLGMDYTAIKKTLEKVGN